MRSSVSDLPAHLSRKAVRVTVAPPCCMSSVFVSPETSMSYKRGEVQHAQEPSRSRRPEQTLLLAAPCS